MSEIETLAVSLASHFLQSGNYESAPTPMEYGVAAGIMPAAVHAIGASDVAPFEGLSVQSVGHGQEDGQPTVFIYVTKGSLAALKKLHQQIEGIPVTVKRMGRLTVRPEAVSSVSAHGNVFERGGRIACGSSCAPAGEPIAGTLGAIVKAGEDEEILFLSNNHVFAACNHTPVEMPILSPSGIDARPGIRAPQEVCRHHQIIELRSGVPLLVQTVKEDAAIAKIYQPDMVSSWQGDDALGYDTPASVAAPEPGLKVKKIGRTTGLTFGTVEALIPTPMPIPYKSRYFTARVWFSDVWAVRVEQPSQYFALPGDSGSLVVSSDNENAVGLLFAASPRGEYGWIAPIDRVLQEFGTLSLVDGHGI